MDTVSRKDPVELISEHAVALRDYAKRTIIRGESLESDEYDDKENRFAEFTAIGHTLDLSERELVCLMFRGVFTEEVGR